ncbi:MAG TPA: glycosyltransferase [Acidimicrobiales bacterium]|nr:glycosyltransferase [Acidimicrobiales bacterium]
MRVLFLTCHLPWPAVSGGRRRELELLRRLPDVEIDLVAVSKTPEEDRRNAGRLAEHCRSVAVFPAEPSARPGQPPHVERHQSDAARRHLRDLVCSGSVDLVHVEGFYLFDLLPRPCPVPTLLVEQNVEHQLCHQRAELARDPADRARLHHEAELTRIAEEAAWRDADACAALTDEDAAAMAQALGRPVDAVVPDGLAVPSAATTPTLADEPTAVFVANFAYSPNVDAAWYLVEEIVPRVRRTVPDARWQLVGNAPPDDLRAAAESDGLEVTGRVPAVESYLDTAHVVTCPLRVGGGVKVKVLEALAHGKATVTTSVGAQGLARVRDAFVVADDPHSFAAATACLLTEPAARRPLEAAARGAVEHLPTWDEAAGELRAAYERVLATQPVLPSRTRIPA